MNPSCTLDPARRERRIEELRSLARDGLTGVTLRFRGDPEIRARVERMVAAESQCCSFLRFERKAGDGELVVTVTGLADLFSGIESAWPRSSSSP